MCREHEGNEKRWGGKKVNAGEKPWGWAKTEDQGQKCDATVSS